MDPLDWAARVLALLAAGRGEGNGRPVLAAAVVGSEANGATGGPGSPGR